MSTTAKQCFERLPLKLKNFFSKYPPSIQYAKAPTSALSVEANPFLPNKHPVTGKYHNPKYSKRRMSDLYKLADRYGITEFLPPMNKQFFEDKYESKQFMKGVLQPKGHKYESTIAERQAKMEKAIANADKTIIDAKGMKYARKLEQKRKKKQVTWI